MKFEKQILPTGLRVLFAPIENNTTITVLVLTATGSKYETKEINGISHFLEHMCFKGTVKRPSAELISKELDQIGGEFNAFTSKEYTGYFAKVRAEHGEIALDVVSDIFSHQLLKTEEIEREKGVIIEEINLYQDTPTSYIGDIFEELLYGDQPAGWKVAGEKKNILSLTQKHFLEYIHDHYSASNSLVIVAGDPKFGAKLFETAKDYFNDVRESIPLPKLHVKEKQNRPGLKIHFKETDQVHIAIGVRAFNILDPRRFALSLLSIILGGGMSSRLFLSVRERHGLAYYIRTETEHYTDSGYLATVAGITKEKINDALQIILHEYKKIRDEHISPEELKKAKEYIKGKMTLGLESSDEVASFLGGQEVLTGKILTPEEIFSNIEKVSEEEVRAVASEIFRPESLNLALIGPFKDEKPFVDILSSF